MKFYKPKEVFLKEAFANDKHIINSNSVIGILLRFKGFAYFLPVDAIDTTDYDASGKIKLNTPTIMRMMTSSTNAIGKCLFSNMFPIPYNEIELYDLSLLSEEEETIGYKKLDYLIKNLNRIYKSAERIYKQKNKGYSAGYLQETVDFKLLEQITLEWEIENMENI